MPGTAADQRAQSAFTTIGQTSLSAALFISLRAEEEGN